MSHLTLPREQAPHGRHLPVCKGNFREGGRVDEGGWRLEGGGCGAKLEFLGVGPAAQESYFDGLPDGSAW